MAKGSLLLLSRKAYRVNLYIVASSLKTEASPVSSFLTWPQDNHQYLEVTGCGLLFQAFLSDKTLESSVKYIVRRFPNIDPKSLSNVQPLRNEVLKSLSLYYYTFVDLLDYRDHVTELLTTIGACGIAFDITVNYDLTRLYLEVVG